MKRTIKLTEKELRQMISESVKTQLNEAENYGWVVDESEVQEAYVIWRLSVLEKKLLTMQL